MCVFVSAPDSSHSAPIAKCKHVLREIYDLDTPDVQNTYVFVTAPDGSHSAPIAKCNHLLREIYDLDVYRIHLFLHRPPTAHTRLLLLNASIPRE